ncbi:hypothetical protein BM527_03865 [Alteromonas sp. Mex14]|nr:hypothetical protein BM527_03865 [Alteromonas sp. Mex14]
MKTLAFLRKASSFLMVVGITGCASVDFLPILNPDAALSEWVDRYGIKEKGISCHGDRKIDCLSASLELQQLLLANPSHTNTQVIASSVFLQSGRRIQAQAVLDELVNQYVPPLVSLVMRTDLALDEGNIKLAKRLNERAISLYADSPKPYLQKASIFYIEGSYEQALSYLSTSLRFGLEESIYYYHLGLINQVKNQFDQACHYYKQSLTMSPPNRAFVVSRLASLEYLPNC